MDSRRIAVRAKTSGCLAAGDPRPPRVTTRDHIVGRSYSPRGGGKVESAIGTLKRELWECFHFEDRAEAERRLSAWVDDYNHRRAHMGIDGLAPSDRSLIDALVDDAGLFLTPPDTRSNTQRIFLPRQAVAELDILAVIKTGSRRGPAEPLQESLFKEQKSST